MILYHGSNVIVKEPKIIKTEIGRDFGFGFYTTDIKEQAIRWARRKAKIAHNKDENNSSAIVSIYEFDENNYINLKCKHFPTPSAEWLDMICKCRSNISFTHDFDIVTGKIANDNVGETVTYVMQGIMRREDAIERLKFEEINNQICFNSNRTLKLLNFIGYEEY